MELLLLIGKLIKVIFLYNKINNNSYFPELINELMSLKLN